MICSYANYTRFISIDLSKDNILNSLGGTSGLGSPVNPVVLEAQVGPVA